MDRAAPPLTERFVDAVELAEEVHGGSRRTGTEVPYMSHLLVVTGLVLEDGGDEDQAIAAMLHDTVEEGGGRALLARIERTFGARVAGIVEACTDSFESDPDQPWIELKRHYLEHLRGITDDAVLRVSLADKVNNARALARDYRHEGHPLWERIPHKTPDEQLWYYGQLIEFFERSRPGALTEDLRQAVDELQTLVERFEGQLPS